MVRKYEGPDVNEVVRANLLKILAVIGAGYAAGSAAAPPPPRPVQCNTVYGNRIASTTCY